MKLAFKLSLLKVTLILSCLTQAQAQAPSGYTYDESKVPKLELRDPLRLNNGSAVTRVNGFWGVRRLEILRMFEQTVYGPFPKKRVTTSVRVLSRKTVFDGAAERSLLTLTLRCEGREQDLHLLLYRPLHKERAPVLLGMNFYGNQSIIADPDIPLAQAWVGNNKALGIEEHRATEQSRGARAERWPVKQIVSRGYGLCTLYYGDVDPDFNDGFKNGVHALVEAEQEWGSVSAWAWGLSRVREVLAKESWASRVGVFGHSRLGKAALWAGAKDSRFSLVISNNSGCGGAALSKRKFGETLKAINERFPHWFVKRFHDFNGREQDLPLDQHLLMATIAPRRLYVTSASEDLWADPKGEQLSLAYASNTFREVGGKTGYHLRPGKHNMLLYDWERILDFADQNW